MGSHNASDGSEGSEARETAGSFIDPNMAFNNLLKTMEKFKFNRHDSNHIGMHEQIQSNKIKLIVF